MIVQPGLAPAASPALDRALLAEVGQRRDVGILRIATLAGDVVALGRYHLAPPSPGRGAVLVRRVAGGRAMPAGDGFVALSLVLPHRAALVADDPRALAPEQVMNRCVRGVLAGLERLGVPALYPGRDTITTNRRIVACAAFEVDARGAALFEVVLAVGTDFTVLPARLDAADPTGVVPTTMLGPDDTTCVARVAGRTPALDELAAHVAAGYESRMSVRVVPRTAPLPAAGAEDAWLGERRPDPALDRRAVARGQLGQLEVRCARAGDALAAVQLSGDFIADSPAVASAERELRGCPVDGARIGDVVTRAFSPPDHFLLGVGPLATVTDTILRAAGA